MKNQILFVLLTLMSTIANSQETSLRVPGEWRGYVLVNSYYPDLSDFNTSLERAGYRGLEGIVHHEFGLRGKSPELRIGLAFSYTYLYASNNDQATFTPGAGTLQNRTFHGSGPKWSLDYHLVDKRLAKLFIPLGLQWTKFRVNTFENIPAGFSFTNPGDIIESKYTSWRMCVESGLNFEQGFVIGHALYNLGVQVGYRYEYGSRPWKYSNELRIDFPQFRHQGFFFGMSFAMSLLRHSPEKWIKDGE